MVVSTKTKELDAFATKLKGTVFKRYHKRSTLK